MSGPRIDVLIPAYNAEATLIEAVASIQRQSVSDIRIVVVDDGSTDATPRLLAELAREDSRIDVFTQANGGIVGALNAGLDLCRAELVARHDADDLADPERFARQLAYLDANRDCVAVSSYARHIDAQGRRLATLARPTTLDQADPRSLPAREPYLMHPFLMARRDALQRVNGYRHVFLSEDTDLYWRLQEVGRLYNLPQILGDYRVHAGSLTSSSVVNARLGALMSQLSAVSAVRRRQGRADLDFPRDDLARYKAAPTFEAMVELGCNTLDAEERAYVTVAAPMKLLELNGYKLFELDLEDCRYARRALATAARTATPQDWKLLAKYSSLAAVRLARRGRAGRALTLTAPRLLPITAARLLYQSAIPDGVRTAVRRRGRWRGVEA